MKHFPIDLGAYRPVALSRQSAALTAEQRIDLRFNIDLCRDAIVAFTALAEARGLGGHTGGAYDTVPELVLFDALCRGEPDRVLPTLFDAAGHRVASQYLLAALRGHLPADELLTYRQPMGRLPGHPERTVTPGLGFSSGRLGHLWGLVNGVALAEPGRAVFCLSSDGCLQEGNDAEAARFAVAQNLKLILLMDDNDSTCSGRTSDYMPAFDVAKTLAGHGLTVDTGDGEDLDGLFARLVRALTVDGPVALVNRRPMCPGIPGVEGTPHGHDALPAKVAVPYLRGRGHETAATLLETAEPHPVSRSYHGRSQKTRHVFDQTIVDILGRMSPQERRARVVCVDSDLGESCGIGRIAKAFPEISIRGGIMERSCFSAAAGFGTGPGRQGIFGTYSAFLEMFVSEITMARLNEANVLCNLSHSGVDELCDNTCHFGLNHFFADNGLDDGHPTTLFYPADGNQARACVEAIFDQPGLRFFFSSRSAVPDLVDVNEELMFGAGYRFEIGKDDLLREGCDGYIVSFGESLYRCLNVVEQLRNQGISIGLVNKSTLNVPDEDTLARIGRAPFVLVVEALNRRTGLGARFGTWLLERGYHPAYAHLGSHRFGCGGLAEQMPHQGLDEAAILAEVLRLHAPRAEIATNRAVDRIALQGLATRFVALPGGEEQTLPDVPAHPELPTRLAAKLGPFRFHPPFAAEVSRVRLVGPDAAGFLADGRVVLETTLDRRDLLGRALARITPEDHDRPDTRRVAFACSFVNVWSHYYAHWLLEGLTRLEALTAYAEAAGAMPALIIDPNPPVWKRDSLRLMGVPEDASIPWDGGPMTVERFVVCSKRREDGRVSARAVRWVRDRILAKLDQDAPDQAGRRPHGRRLYVSRRDAAARRVVNEDALMQALAPLGFERVCTERLSFEEEVRLFRHVECVVGPYGGGFANLMFAESRPLVVEFFGQKLGHFYLCLSLALGFDYRVLMCEPVGDDLRVDVPAFLRLLDGAL